MDAVRCASSSMPTMMAGFASASAVGSDRSRKTAPSSSPQRSMLTVPGSIPITRGTTLLRIETRGHVGDCLRVENEVVALEQTGDARLVDLHFETTDTERPEHRDAMTVGAVVGDVDALDPQRRNRVDVNGGPQGPSCPRLARHQTDAGASGVEQQLGAFEHRRCARAVCHHGRMNGRAEAFLDRGG